MADKNLDKLLSDSYTNESISSHTGLTAVRLDPSRYITQTDKYGIYNMVLEILDNSVDESGEVLKVLKEQLGDNVEPLVIYVYLNPKTGDCVVSDQGRGVEMKMNETYPDLYTLNALFEQDNTGGKGRRMGVDNTGYKGMTIGVHGAGAFVVTACSEYMVIENRRFNPENGNVEVYRTSYSKGEPVINKDFLANRVEYIGVDNTIIANGRRQTGLTVSFRPDLDVMSLFNPATNRIEEDYFLIDRIKKRIIDTLHTIEDPLIIHLDVEGEVPQIYDSRELSITHDLVEGEDYLRIKIEPDEPEIKRRMEYEKVSDFNLDLLLIRHSDPSKRIDYEGYVNRIRVSSSPHIETVRASVLNAIQSYCSEDPDLKGYFRSQHARGIYVAPILSVANAQWGSQVKTDYTDYQVANYVGICLAHSGAFERGGILDPMIKRAFEASKPYLLAEKRREEEIERIREQQLEEEIVKIRISRNIEKVNADLAYLNSKGEFLYNGNVSESDLIILEGKSGSTNLQQLMDIIPNIAVCTSVEGKIENYNNLKRTPHDYTLEEMDQRGMPITPLDKLDATLKAPFRRIISMTDNDADGKHIKALLRFYIWKEFRHLVEEGRLFDVSPSYCNYQAPEGLRYKFQGEEKVLQSYGDLRTSEEYDLVRRLFPGKVRFTLFKGIGSASIHDLKTALQDIKNWEQVPPLSPKEEYELYNLFTDSSQFKKVYTRSEYLTDDAIRKELVKSTVYKDTTITPEELFNPNLMSDYPVFTSASRKTIEDYENKGSASIELEQYKDSLESALTLH